MKPILVAMTTVLISVVFTGCATWPQDRTATPTHESGKQVRARVAPGTAARQRNEVWVGVQSDMVSVKAKALPWGAPVAHVNLGDPLTVLNQNGSWLRVRTREGKEGWIHNLVTCDANSLEGRKRSGMIPTAVLLLSDFRDERTFNLSILAGGIKADLTLVKGTCVAVQDEPALVNVRRITAFKGGVLNAPSPGILYYYTGKGAFVPLSAR